MDQQAEHSETLGTLEAETRLDDEPAQSETAPTPAIEPQDSIFPDPFEEDAGEPAPREAFHSTCVSDIADDSVVDCVRESDYAPEAERSDEDLPDDVTVGAASRTIFGDTTQLVRNADPAEIAPADSATAAQIVGTALHEIVSDLVGSLLPAVRANESVGDAVSASHASACPAARQTAGPSGTPGADDHSYQWHAFQQDDDAAPAKPWVDDDDSVKPATPTPFVAGAAVDGAARAASSAGLAPGPRIRVRVRGAAPTKAVEAPDATADGAKPGTASDHRPDGGAAFGDATPKSAGPAAASAKADPDSSGHAPEGLLDYESSADPDKAAAAPTRGGGWTIPVLCAGIGIIACCLLIPLCDANRHAAYEKLRLRRDLESLQHQVAINDEFLHKVADDPTLAERLAERQLRKIRAGTHIVPLKGDDSRTAADFGSMSPFGIVAIPAPPPMAPYQPVGGRIATLCYNPHTRLYLMGAGMMLMAMGLVMGYAPVERGGGVVGRSGGVVE